MIQNLLNIKLLKTPIILAELMTECELELLEIAEIPLQNYVTLQ